MKKLVLNPAFLTILSLLSLSKVANAQTISAGDFHSLAICSDGTVKSWGSNIYGELGNGDTINSNLPVPVSQLSGIIDVIGGLEFSLALRKDSTVWVWGLNGYSQLGNGTTTNSNLPIQVNTLKDVIAIAKGSTALHVLVLKNDGTVWAWGFNMYGQLGNNTTTNSNVPFQVNSLNGINAVAVGINHSLAIKNGGFVWAWGDNKYGQLGNGTNTASYVPVNINTLIGVTALSSGDSYSLALKSDSTVWAWGYNGEGELGNSTNTNSNVPVNISGLSGIVAISSGNYHSLALKSDGTVWAWGGHNKFGELGNGTTTGSNVPVKVSVLKDIVAISCGYYHNLALKNDGTVWAWGGNFTGQLGDGITDTINVLPIQVPGLCQVAAAIKETVAKSLISIYPNPSNGIFHLNIANLPQTKGDIAVYNVLGEKVYATQNLAAQTEIDLTAFTKGIYFVKVTCGKEVYNQKIIIE